MSFPLSFFAPNPIPREIKACEGDIGRRRPGRAACRSFSARAVRSRRWPPPSSRGQASKHTGGVRHKSSGILARLLRRGTGKRLQEGFRASWRDVVPRVVELLQRSTPAAFNTSARSCVLLSYCFDFELSKSFIFLPIPSAPQDCAQGPHKSEPDSFSLLICYCLCFEQNFLLPPPLL